MHRSPGAADQNRGKYRLEHSYLILKKTPLSKRVPWARRSNRACAWLRSEVQSPGRSCAHGIGLPRRACPLPSSGAAPVHAFGSLWSSACCACMEVPAWRPSDTELTHCSVEQDRSKTLLAPGHAPADTRPCLNNVKGRGDLSVVHAGTGGRSSSSGRAPTAPNDTIFLNSFERRNSTSATTAGGSSRLSSYRRAKVRKPPCRHPREPFAPHARAPRAR